MPTVTAPSKARKRPSSELSDERLLEWLRMMQLIREFESRTMQAYQQAKIGGFCHIYSGQEAVVVGTFGAVNHDDPVVTAYRDHGHALARGMDPKRCMAEMFGKQAGCAKGKGGSMHMFDKPNHLYGGHGIVGAQTPLGAGLAFAAKYEMEVLGTGSKKVALCYLGDGALNQGALHEAMNLAGLWSLPVIYIVENNGYSMGTSIARGTTMPEDLPLKAKGYGIHGETIEGMDALELYDRFKPIADMCREEQKPAFVDVRCYRFKGHSMSDPQKYRTKEEVSGFETNKDPIRRLLRVLMEERKCLDEQGWERMREEITEQVREAVRFAEEAPEPDPETELYSDVLVNPSRGMSPSGEYTLGGENELIEETGE